MYALCPFLWEKNNVLNIYLSTYIRPHIYLSFSRFPCNILLHDPVYILRWYGGGYGAVYCGRSFLCGRNHRNYDYNIFVKWDGVGIVAQGIWGRGVLWGCLCVCIYIHLTINNFYAMHIIMINIKLWSAWSIFSQKKFMYRNFISFLW